MKGILKTFEAVLGVSLIMFTFIALFTAQEPLPDFETISWKASGTEGLEALDLSNQLRYDALNNNTAVLEGKLEKYLPPSVDILLQVCDDSCEAPVLNAEKSTTSHYLISGEAGNSTSKEVILYVWSQE